MKRSSQEIIELIVFALIALTVGTGLMWVLGQIFAVLAVVLGFLSGIIWFLLRFLIPISLVAALVYFAVDALLSKNKGPNKNHSEGSFSSKPKSDIEIKTSLDDTETSIAKGEND